MPTRRAISLGSALLAVAAFGACGGDDDAETLDEIEESIAEGDLDDDSDRRTTATAPIPARSSRRRTSRACSRRRPSRAKRRRPRVSACRASGRTPNTPTRGRCTSSSVNVYDGEEYYAADTIEGETEIADLGDRAYVSTSSEAPEHVEVQFVQDGKNRHHQLLARYTADERRGRRRPCRRRRRRSPARLSARM